MSNVIPMRKGVEPTQDEIIDTSAARMKSLERDLKAVNGGGSIFTQQERRAGMAIAAIEWEANRLAALIGDAAALDEINRRVIKQLAQRLQP